MVKPVAIKLSPIESATSTWLIGARSSGRARHENVSALLLVRSITPAGDPANARAISTFSPIRSCTAEAITRISSIGASCTSSMAINRPLEDFAAEPSNFLRLDSLGTTSTLAETKPAFTPTEA